MVAQLGRQLARGEDDARVRLEAEASHAADRLERAGVGRTEDNTLDLSIRRDKTKWFDRSSAAQTDYLDLMETVRQTVNQELFLGLFSFVKGPGLMLVPPKHQNGNRRPVFGNSGGGAVVEIR